MSDHPKIDCKFNITRDAHNTKSLHLRIVENVQDYARPLPLAQLFGLESFVVGPHYPLAPP